jgi:hypothetical protein
MFDSQCTQIVEYIKTHGSITQDDATGDIGCKRLAARVKDLRRKGFPIVTNMETGLNRNRKPVRYARYTIEEGNYE